MNILFGEATRQFAYSKRPIDSMKKLEVTKLADDRHRAAHARRSSLTKPDEAAAAAAAIANKKMKKKRINHRQQQHQPICKCCCCKQQAARSTRRSTVGQFSIILIMTLLAVSRLVSCLNHQHQHHHHSEQNKTIETATVNSSTQNIVIQTQPTNHNDNNDNRDGSTGIDRQHQQIQNQHRNQNQNQNQNQLARFHLSHHQPPSLVPLTIERSPAQASASATSTTRGLSSSVDRRQPALAQLQLPIELHLKLRPLALPLPPPPPPPPLPPSSSLTAARQAAEAAQQSVAVAASKRKRSLSRLAPDNDHHRDRRAPASGQHQEQQDNRPTGEKARQRLTLEALSWQEAKRALLSSVSPTSLQRRSLLISAVGQEPTTTTTTSTTAPTTTTTTSQRATSFLGGGNETAATTTRQPAPVVGEIRRQRHSSQREHQQQQEPNNNNNGLVDEQRQQLADLSADSGFQAMAAAMLPFFWPSFQLSGKQLAARQLPTLASATTESSILRHQLVVRPTRDAAGSTRPMNYATSDGPTDSVASPTWTAHASPGSVTSPAAVTTTTPTPTPTTTPRPSAGVRVDKPARGGRRRQRKPPGYLMGALVSSTPYPDSTRLASKYPMPKIKFTAASTTSSPSPAAPFGVAEVEPTSGGSSSSTTSSQPPTATRGEARKIVQVPKELSKLIEQQLQVNGSFLLQQHRGQKKGGGPAPSTSISKVIRLANETSASSRTVRLAVAATFDTEQQQQDLKRTPTTIPRGLATTPEPTTTTTTKRTDMRQEEIGTRDEVASQNQVLPEEESEVRRPAATVEASGGARKPTKFGGADSEKQANNLNAGNNIKLFHFKRKPDMNKLPFYKKPLNYTELGWTSEQIQEHLESIGFAPSSSSSGDLSPVGDPPEEASPSRPANSTASMLETTNLLLKRKRRGKNQFERLMAELHGESEISSPPAAAAAAAASSSTQRTAPRSADEPAPVVERLAQTEAAAASGKVELVPALKAKLEPLVMRPMFFAMHQKNRSSQSPKSSTAPMQQDEIAQTTTPAVAFLEVVSSTSPSTASTSSMSKSATGQPIVRMRRKHHGDQPLSTSMISEEQREFANGWRSASKPTTARLRHSAAAAATVNSSPLLLVPSGLLTPSGSHLMPLFAPTSKGEQESSRPIGATRRQSPVNLTRGPTTDVVANVEQTSKLVEDFFAWRPARHVSPQRQPQQQQQQQRPPVMKKPSGGLAPSGEENFLLAPVSPLQATAAAQSSPTMMLLSASTQPKPAVAVSIQQQQQQPAIQMTTPAPASPPPSTSTPATAGELRVPKLLVKPMRPAKYSLNGYIPKPSLSLQMQQQPQQQATTSMASQQQLQHQHQHQQPAMSKRQRKQQQQPLAMSSRDLDSSTSNEIFSRRRGLQQHLRGHQAANGLALGAAAKMFAESFSGLLQATSGGQTNQTTLAARQMEENKRKYILQLRQQRQLNQSPVLSVQKANMIKAKLGLAISQSASRSRPTDSKQQPSASTVHAITADPAAEQNHLSVEQRHALLVGAASTGTIPKTDFECADKKGRFLSGLFADTKTGCQVWHLCSNNRKYSFLCPSGTIFSQKLGICDWRYNVRCGTAA